MIIESEVSLFHSYAGRLARRVCTYSLGSLHAYGLRRSSSRRRRTGCWWSDWRGRVDMWGVAVRSVAVRSVAVWTVAVRTVVVVAVRTVWTWTSSYVVCVFFEAKVVQNSICNARNTRQAFAALRGTANKIRHDTIRHRPDRKEGTGLDGTRRDGTGRDGTGRDGARPGTCTTRNGKIRNETERP